MQFQMWECWLKRDVMHNSVYFSSVQFSFQPQFKHTFASHVLVDITGNK
jgi:hypothetical protein